MDRNNIKRVREKIEPSFTKGKCRIHTWPRSGLLPRAALQKKEERRSPKKKPKYFHDLFRIIAFLHFYDLPRFLCPHNEIPTTVTYYKYYFEFEVFPWYIEMYTIPCGYVARDVTIEGPLIKQISADFCIVFWTWTTNTFVDFVNQAYVLVK